jgi:ubiquinone/menaquinone biosynthesis C-methylase UbiE
MNDQLTAMKQGAHAVWAAGDFSVIAQLIEGVGVECAEQAGAAPGIELLDVACGSGNVAIPAAERGARVTGLDLTPELFDAARARAAAAGVEVELLEGDAEDLPFEDASFDRVTSTFGVQFAPRHEVAAAEIARVCRPGGKIVIYNWTLEGLVGRLFDLIGSYMPSPPDFASPPALWGNEEHVRQLFPSIDLTFERRMAAVPAESPELFVQHFEKFFGPTIMAKRALEPQGRWQELREQYVDLIDEHFHDGKVHQEYFAIEGARL